MNSTLELILKDFENLKGQFVITESWKIERLIAIGTDDMDYYYVTYNGRKITWNSCVGKIIQLKNKINDNDYEGLIRLAKINHFDQPELYIPSDDVQKLQNLDFNKYHKEKIMALDEPNKYITEVCWELN